jgi:hypothetical protein
MVLKNMAIWHFFLGKYGIFFNFSVDKGHISGWACYDTDDMTLMQLAQNVICHFSLRSLTVIHLRKAEQMTKVWGTLTQHTLNTLWTQHTLKAQSWKISFELKELLKLLRQRKMSLPDTGGFGLPLEIFLFPLFVPYCT